MPVPVTTPSRAARDRAKAAALEEQIKGEKFVEFRLACDDSDATGCHSLGEWWAVIKEDFEKAADIYRVNCLERKHGPSCYNLGRFHGEFRDGTHDAAHATTSDADIVCLLLSQREGCGEVCPADAGLLCTRVRGGHGRCVSVRGGAAFHWKARAEGPSPSSRNA